MKPKSMCVSLWQWKRAGPVYGKLLAKTGKGANMCAARVTVESGRTTCVGKGGEDS